MSRTAQLGVFTIILGGIVLFMAIFPGAVDADAIPGIGMAQMLMMLGGIVLVITGGYVMAYAILKQGRRLARDIGVRLGLTGLVFSTAATMADVLGFGTHIGEDGPLFGWLQAVGMLTGFVIAAAGVLVYGLPPKETPES
nr:hypothetical protein [Anaerolineae bacterium]